MSKKDKKQNDDLYHKKFSLFSNVKYLLGEMKEHSKSLFVFFPIAFFVLALNRYIWSFLSKFIIDLVTNNGSVKSLLILIGIFSALILFIFFMQTFYYNKTWSKFIFLRIKILMKMNFKMMTMPFEYYENPKILDCAQKALNATSSNNDGIEGMTRQMFNFVQQLGAVICGLILLGTMNIWIVVGMTLLAFINFFISNNANRYNKKTIWDKLSTFWRKNNYMNFSLADFSFAKDIRMYGIRNFLTQKFQKIQNERYEAEKRNAKFWFWISFATTILWILSQIGVYAYLIYRIFNHSLTIGNFTLYLASSITFFDCISAMLNSVTTLLKTSREVDDFRSFMNLVNSETQSSGSLKVPTFDSYTFEFKNVSFKYPGEENYALKNLNITLNAGERLAVVGLNGAGKTTFIKLLLRLYEPTEGKIFLNGMEISQFDKDSYYEIFSPVFQEVNLFAFSLLENVSMCELENTNEENAKSCLKKAGLEEKLKSLPKGINTQMLKIIYDDGVELSGGEKQKLALARALYKNSPVVVLDEPTASLDALAESKLYQDFNDLIGGKTSVYISHRLSSTKFCDKIAFFKDGTLCEYGTHNSLMKKKGDYAQMFKVQSQYYVENEKSEN